MVLAHIASGYPRDQKFQLGVKPPLYLGLV